MVAVAKLARGWHRKSPIPQTRFLHLRSFDASMAENVSEKDIRAKVYGRFVGRKSRQLD